MNKIALVLLSDCPADGRTWVPSEGRCYHFVHGEEDIVKSYTFERAQTFCQGFGSYCFVFLSIYLKSMSLYVRFDCVYIPWAVPELVTIQSKEENDFILKYSPEVWKGNINVWLGMYYDTNSKYS